MLLYKREDPVRVGEEAQGEDAVEVHAFYRGADGFGARGDDEPVVGVLELLVARKVFDGELFVVRVYLLHAVAGEDLDVPLGELFRGAGDKVVAVIDDAGEQVRQSTLALRDLRLLLINDYLKVGVNSPGSRSRLSPRCHSSDYDQTHLTYPFRFE